MNIPTHQLLMVDLAYTLADQNGDSVLKSFLTAEWRGWLKDGEDLADSGPGASVALPRWDEIVAVPTLAAAGGALERYFLRNSNSLHHFAEPGYSLANDGCTNNLSKAWIDAVKTYFVLRWADDCDSILDPLSLNQNWGDQERYELCYMDGTSTKGYCFRSAPRYAKLLWLEYWNELTQDHLKNAAVALGKIAHLAQDLAAVPQHSTLTIGDNHKYYEDELDEYIRNNRDSILRSARGLIQTRDEYGGDGCCGQTVWSIARFNMFEKMSKIKDEVLVHKDKAISDDPPTREGAMKELAPVALAQTYSILKLGQIAKQALEGKGNCVVGGIFSVVAPQTGMFSDGSYVENTVDYVLPPGYFLDRYETEEDWEESRDVVERQITPISDGLTERLRVRYKVHGKPWWGGRGWEVNWFSVYGRPPTLNAWIQYCNYLNTGFVNNRYRKDTFRLRFNWDCKLKLKPKFTLLQDGKAMVFDGQTEVNLDSLKGSRDVDVEFLIRGSNPANYQHKLELIVKDPSAIAEPTRREILIDLPKPWVEIVQKFGAPGPDKATQSFPPGLANIEEVREASEQEVSDLWDRRIVIEEYVGRKPAPGTAHHILEIGTMSMLGFIKSPIFLEFTPRYMVGTTRLSGKRTIAILKKGLVSKIREENIPELQSGYNVTGGLSTPPPAGGAAIGKPGLGSPPVGPKGAFGAPPAGSTDAFKPGIRPAPAPTAPEGAFTRKEFDNDTRVGLEVNAVDGAAQEFRTTQVYYARILIVHVRLIAVPIVDEVQIASAIDGIWESVVREMQQKGAAQPAALAKALPQAKAQAWEKMMQKRTEYVLAPLAGEAKPKRVFLDIKSRMGEKPATFIEQFQFRDILMEELRSLVAAPPRGRK